MNMIRGLQSTLGGFDAKFKQQGDKMDNVVSGQNEVKAAVKNFESKLESVEKEMSTIKADHNKLAEEFSIKIQHWSQRITALEELIGKKANWHDMTVDDDEEDMDSEDAEQAKAHKRHRNGLSIPSRRASSVGVHPSASHGGSKA